MARYIDAEKFMFDLDDIYKDFVEDSEKNGLSHEAFSDTIHALGLAKALIYYAPTVAMKPVTHGVWHEVPSIGVGGIDYVCSVCGFYDDEFSNYCPACGAEMDFSDEQIERIKKIAGK